MAKVRWHLPALTLCYGLVVCLLVAFLVPAPWLTTAFLVLSPMLFWGAIASAIVLWQLVSYLRGNFRLTCPTCGQRAAAHDFDGRRVVLDCPQCRKFRVTLGWLGDLPTAPWNAKEARREQRRVMELEGRGIVLEVARSPMILGPVLAPAICSIIAAAIHGELRLFQAFASIMWSFCCGVSIYSGLRSGVLKSNWGTGTRSRSPLLFWITLSACIFGFTIGILMPWIPLKGSRMGNPKNNGDRIAPAAALKLQARLASTSD
jgi:hypothetical protein